MLSWNEDLRVNQIAFSEVMSQSDSLALSPFLGVLGVRKPGFRTERSSPPAGFAPYQQVIICSQPYFKDLVEKVKFCETALQHF